MDKDHRHRNNMQEESIMITMGQDRPPNHNQEQLNRITHMLAQLNMLTCRIKMHRGWLMIKPS